MIKSVTLTSLAKSKKDFEILCELLERLGLRKGFAGENKNARSAEFFPSKLKLDVLYRKRPWDDSELTVWLQNPDVAFELIQNMNLEIQSDHSGPEPSHGLRDFTVRLPGGTRIMFLGARVDDNATDSDYVGIEGNLKSAGKHFGIVVSRFNSFITERLLAGAIDGLVRCGGEFYRGYDIVRVPGAFEIPSAARTLAQTKKYDAIICLGCLLRGDTAHYDVIVNEVTRGIGQSAQETGVPHAFGVLTCDTLEQAIDRAGLKMGNKGFEAALAAIEMANLKTAISSQPLALGNKRAAVNPRSKLSGKQQSAEPRTKTRGHSQRKTQNRKAR